MASAQIKAMFDKIKAKQDAAGGAGDADIPDLDDVLAVADKKSSNSNKRLSVERIYQKKSQLEHILLRPDTYIGSVEHVTQNMWVWNEAESAMVQRDISYVPGLYKIFDEILVNAADNKQRDPKMSTIKIDIDPEANMIKIWNDGKGIPVVEHKVEKVFVPTLIFGTLLTSSNYDDTEKKVTGGRNGFGAKLCNIFSKKFMVETSAKDYHKSFKQSWSENMGKASEVILGNAKDSDFTCVTFYPDLSKFKMDKLDQDTMSLFTRRAYDIAASSRGLKVILNGKRLPIKSFKDYCELYIKSKTDDSGNPLKLVHEIVNDRWEVACTLSEKGFQQVSFVNSIATTKGGRHTDYIADQIVSRVIEVVKKKNKKEAVSIKPFQVKNHLWVFVNCLIENPSFDSQTKENMTLQSKSFGSKASLTEKFGTQVTKCGIVESIMSWMKFKAQEKLASKCGKTKQTKIKGIPKLDDANDAGSRNSSECTLILTEGDSAKSLVVAGLGVIGRDHFGVFPLRGKLLNVREATSKSILDNAEINNVIKIVGLRYKMKYNTPETLKTLRYGKLMIMTDQDQDGSHIKGLLINFIHFNWPDLLRQNFLEEFITPIVKVHKKKESRSFYSLPEFEEWKKETDDWHTWECKYYKGLGTSTSKEAKEYFSDMERHRIPFTYKGAEDDSAIELAFSKKMVESRKEWLTNFMEERKRRAQLDLPELYLYGKDTKRVSYNEFINRELILFSNADNERSIPSLCDGLKPGQRKVMFTFFKRNITKAIKVAQIAGSVSELSAYHHGEQSLMATIINLAQNFVGSNNLHLLEPIGQFGTRLQGGKDAASPRYIFTKMSTLTRLLFNPNDEPLLCFNFDDGRKIEPEWYLPIIPMVLVNGAEGIGTGWSTKIQNYDVREIIRNIRAMIDGREPTKMMPSYKNFHGTIEQLEEQRYAVSGEVAILDDTTIEITELPVRMWTQSYKESVLEPMLMGTEKVPASIVDYKEYHTDTTVRFVVKLTPEKMATAMQMGLHKFFKVQTTISTSSMVLFDDKNCLRTYENVNEILKEFFDVRLDMYRRRKDYLEGMLAAESLKLDNQARFILEKIKGDIVIENKPKKELVQVLISRGYDSDPVKTWKDAQNKLDHILDVQEEEDESQSVTSSAEDRAADFNYILGMALWCLTKEKKEALIKERDNKAEQLYQLRKKTPTDLWTDDLDTFEKELEVVEKKEREDDEATIQIAVKSAKGRKTVKKAMGNEDTKPDINGRRVEPVVHESFKKSAAATTKKRKAAEDKSEVNGIDISDDESSNLNLSLAERIGGSPAMVEAAKKATKAPAAKKPRAKKEPGSPKKPREKKPSGSPKKGKGKKEKPTKGKQKKNPWSSDEGSEEEISDIDDFSDEDMAVPVPARERVPKRAAGAAAKYNFDDDEDEDNSNDAPPANEEAAVLSDGSDFDFAPTKSIAKSKKDVFGGDDSEDDDAPVPEPEPVSNNKASSKALISSDEEDDAPIFPPPAAKVEDKPAAAKKPTVKKTLEKKVPEPKEQKPKKPKAAPKRKSTEDSDEESEKPKKKAAKKQKKVPDFSSDEEEMSFSAKDLDDEVAPAPSRGGGRARKQVKYNFDDSEEDEGF